MKTPEQTLPALPALKGLGDLAEPPSSETVELSENDLIDLCERLKRQGRYIAILEVVKGSRWRAAIRQLPASERRTA